MASARKRTRTEMFGRDVALGMLRLTEESFEGIPSDEESDLDHQLYDLSHGSRTEKTTNYGSRISKFHHG